MEKDTAYPGWAPNPNSKIVSMAKEVLEEVTGGHVKVCFRADCACYFSLVLLLNSSSRNLPARLVKARENSILLQSPQACARQCGFPTAEYTDICEVYEIYLLLQNSKRMLAWL